MSPRITFALVLCVYVLALCVLVSTGPHNVPTGATCTPCTFVPAVQLDPAQVRWAAS